MIHHQAPHEQPVPQPHTFHKQPEGERWLANPRSKKAVATLGKHLSWTTRGTVLLAPLMNITFLMQAEQMTMATAAVAAHCQPPQPAMVAC